MGLEAQRTGALAAQQEALAPAQDFYSRDVARLEEERLWPKVWLIVCREQELQNRGDYVVHDIGKESIFVIRTEKGIKGYYNVCQHRGRRLKDGDGNSGKSIYCPFHAWRWNLDGSLAHRTNEADWAGEPLCSHAEVALKEVRVETWGGWVWFTMDPDIKPLLEYLAPIPEKLAVLELEDCKIAWHKILHFPCNWKLVLNAFNEAYHVEGTHTQLKRYELPQSVSKALGDHGWFGYAPARDKPAGVDATVTGESVNTPPANLDFRKLTHARMQETMEWLRCLVSVYGIEAARRLSEELPETASLQEVQAKQWELHRTVMEERGAKWPEGITRQGIADIGTNYHIFPNTIALPCVDGAQWYRARPDGDDPEKCIFEIWWLMRFAPGEEPEVQHDEYPTLADFEGQNPFLEQDFSNLLANQKGIHSRGFQGLRTNPAQEMSVRNFSRALHRYLTADGDPT
jgi:phenylpropionate dioxygenase-like ring-hydroxylating dioxygenase large terminal subunit